MGVLLGEVSVALYFVLFDERAQHEDGRHVVLLYHSPKVVETVAEGTLSGDGAFPLQFYGIGVDVIFHFLVFGRWSDVNA